MRLRVIFIAIIALFFSNISTAQLLQWNTFGNTGTETSEPSIFNNANIAASNLTLGAGVTVAGNGNRFGGSNWFDAIDTNPTTLAESVAGNDYIQFTVTPAVGFSFTPTSLVFIWDKSGTTGPLNVALRSSTDGYSSDLGVVTGISPLTFATSTISIAGLSNITSATTFRLYGYGATQTTGTGGLDTNVNAVNVTLNGTTAATGIITIANGDYNTPGIWSTGSVPTSAQTAIIAHSVTSNVPLTRDAGTTTTINTGATLTVNSSYTSNGATIVNGTFETSNTLGVSIGAGGSFLVNGTLNILPGGFFNNAPTYGASSTLVYKTGGTYGRGFEWSALGVGTIGVTPGYPNNVQLSTSGTILNYTNGTPQAKAMAGSLTIDAGTSLLMDFGSVSSAGALTVGNNVSVAGTISLGTAVGDDLKLGGNLTFTGAGNLVGNNRAVFFTKNGTQTITSALALTIPYIVLAPVSGATTVQLLSNLTVSGAAGGNAVMFSSASDVIDINGRTLSIGTVGVASVVSGAGTFKGSTTSNLTITGTGSIGTLNFTSGGQSLGTFTVNRTAGAVACVLGTPVSVSSSLALTNGIVDLGNNTLTVEATAAITGASASNFVIADSGYGANSALRRGLSAAPAGFAFPIGDRAASADGMQYSPVVISGSGGSYASAYITVSVTDLKHPNLDATADYLTRYWDIASTGISGISLTAIGGYLDTDIVGAEANLLGNKWNGTVWSNGGGAANVPANNTNTIPITLTGTNQITAGRRDAEINVHVATVNYLTGSTYNFGTVLVGGTNQVTFTIQNLGQASLSLAAPSTSPVAPFVYTAPYTPGSLSGPLGTRTFVVTFTPTAAGTFTGSITIPSNDASEPSYTINFTGVGQIPAPEINVRGNSITIAPGNTPTGLDNTLWTAQNIGTTSAAKTFEIQNTGSAVLTLNTPYVALGGANPGDFALSSMPSNSIAAASSSTYAITFTPTMAGVRTATVTVYSNDSDEPTYTYNIQGSGSCATATNTITPLSGPVGTEVTITATANNLTGATATFNGVAAALTVISATQIKVTVPTGATTGSLVTTNSQGCTATNYFTVIENAITSCQGTGSARTQLFISEVTDHGSGSHSYVEIWNATGAAVNLLNYTVKIHNNGAAMATSTITLPSFSLANNSGYVVAFGGVDATSNPGGVTPNLTNAASGINDDDNVRLYNSSSTWLDVWGDPTGTAFTVAPKDYYYRRKNTGIVAPSTTWNPNDWTAGTPVDYSNVGFYDFSTGTPPTVTAQPSFTPSCKSTSLTVAGAEGFAGGNPLAYQWYAVAPGATTWTALTDGGVYSGTSTATLNISNIAGLDGYQFYSQIRENGATCYTASNAVMIDEALTVTWNGSAWTPSAPTVNNIAVIAGNYNTLVNGSFEACSVTVNGGSTLTIGASNYVSIQNDLTVNATGILQVMDDGSLVMVDNAGVVTNNGTTQIQKTTSPYNKFDYTYWSSPVSSATIGATFPLWRTDYAFVFATANYADIVAPVNGFDDDNNAWQYTAPATVMAGGKGYAIMAPTTGTFPATSTVTFSGAVNNGIITTPLALSGNAANATDDYNLIGNPYPSSIFADTFINTNLNTSGTLYFWTHRTGISSSNPGPDANNFITADYAMYNLSGGTSSGTGSPVPTGYVASGQGFFVEAITATNVTFNNAMRSKNYINTNFYRTSDIPATLAATEKDRLWVNLQHADGLFSQQLVGYFNEATMDYDRGYDGMVNQTSNTISFYSFIGADQYRIQGRAAFDVTDQVPMGYSTAIASSFSIALDRAEGILNADATNVFVEDKLLGIIHNLKQSAYNFTTDAGTFNDRFVLRYTDTALQDPVFDDAAENVVAFAQNSQLNIRSEVSEIKDVTVYDLLGRQILQVNDVSDNLLVVSNLALAKQTLIVKITLENGAEVTRKIIF